MKRAVVFVLTTIFLTGMIAYSREGTVRGSYINVRQDGDFKAPIITKKLRGDVYTVLFERNSWAKVSFKDGTEGWIYLSLVEKSASDNASIKADEPAKQVAAPKLPEKVKSATKPVQKAEDKAVKSVKPPAVASEPADLQIKSAQPPQAVVKPEPVKENGDKTEKNTKTAGVEQQKRSDEPDASDKPAVPEKPVQPSDKSVTSATAEDLYNEAVDMFEKRQYARALELNRSALLQAPKNAEIMNNIGNCLFKMGKISDAVTIWKDALDISPKSGKICNNLGIAYYQLDENARAIEFYKKALLFEPEFADPYYNLASVYGFEGKYEDALRNYRKFLELAPDKTMKQITEDRIEYCRKQIDLAAKKSGEGN